MDVSIIIPTYNRAWSILKAIESCRSSELDVQIIVVDDGSTDNTLNLLSHVPGIEIYHQQNWGKPWAVNMAFTHAKGKYIKFLDSDDWLITGTLLKQYQLAEKSNADVVVAGYDLYNDDAYERTIAWTNCDDFIAQNLGECDSSHYTAFLFKKDFIKDIPHRTSFAAANFASRDDRCFMLEVAIKDPKITVLNESAFCHSFHEKGRLQFQKRIGAICTNYQHWLIYRNIIKQLKDSDRLTQRRIEAASDVLWHLSHWIAQTHIAEGYEVYKWLYELNPGYKPVKNKPLATLYKNLGFTATEKILKLKRNIGL